MARFTCNIPANVGGYTFSNCEFVTEDQAIIAFLREVASKGWDSGVCVTEYVTIEPAVEPEVIVPDETVETATEPEKEPEDMATCGNCKAVIVARPLPRKCPTCNSKLGR